MRALRGIISVYQIKLKYNGDRGALSAQRWLHEGPWSTCPGRIESRAT